jgi:hypothetical protein
MENTAKDDLVLRDAQAKLKSSIHSGASHKVQSWCRALHYRQHDFIAKDSDFDDMR